MRLPEICIKHPVFALVLNLLLILLGILGYQQLEIRYFPKLDFPQLTITTRYDGAGTDLIENSITRKIENALAGVGGIATISSSSSQSTSSITIRFRIGGNFEEQVNAVRDKLSSVRKDLPAAAEAPLISVGGRDRVAISIGFTDSQKTSAQIRDYVQRSVQPLLTNLPGVGAVRINGASEYALRIWIDAEKMATLGITVSDVKQALLSNNIQFPAGAVQGPNRNYQIVSNTQLTNVEQFARIVIAKREGGLLRLSDIAEVKLGSRSLQERPMRINGQPGVAVEVQPQRGFNPVDISASVREVIAQITPNLPKGMHAAVNYDQADFLKASIKETSLSIIEAIFLVVLIAWLFLGSIRAASVPVFTIPVCVFSVFGLMYFLGFSINVMTLLAVVLSIGLVVDDAIVMLENCHRYVEQGMAPMQAAIKGSREIAMPVVAMTLTLAAVYAPLGFAGGYSAAIMREFAFTLAGVVIISGFVALTLSPVMCAYLLKPNTTKHSLMQRLDSYFDQLAAAYQRSLSRLLSMPKQVLIVLLALTALGFALYRLLPAEFVPSEDTGFIEVEIKAPTGANVAYTDRYVRQLEAIFATFPSIKAYYSLAGAGSATSSLALKPWSQRNRKTAELVAALDPKMRKVAGVEAYATVPDPIDYGNLGSDVSIQLMTAKDYQALQVPTQRLMAAMKNIEGLQNITSQMQFDDQQFSLTINRDLAADLGVSIQAIADTLSAMLGGAHVSDLNNDGKSYRVIVQMQQKDLENFAGIEKLYVQSANKEMIPLTSLIKITPTIGQSRLRHFNRLRSIAVNAQLAPGYTLSDVLPPLKLAVSKAVTSDTRYAFDGKMAQFIESAGSMLGLFALALIFIYLTLSAQFGSFTDPFIILLTVPLSIVGAMFFLWLSRGSLNLYSQIGFVTLIGMIAKHGILITQFANQLRRQGEPVIDAVKHAASIRLRPILMTTSAMVIGSLPLAFATGPGAIGRQQIGWVIVGGLLVGTFFSLVVVPLAYRYLARQTV